MRLFWRLLISCYFLYPLGSIWAQSSPVEGFIVNLQGDTITGEILVQLGTNKYERCTFKADFTQSYQDYTSNEVSTFGILPNWKYQSFVLPNEGGIPVFMRCLFAGETEVYIYKMLYFLFSRKKGLVELPMKKVSIERNGKTYSQPSNKLSEILPSLQKGSTRWQRTLRDSR